MTVITDKYNCGNCDFWQEDAGLQPADAPGLKLSDGGIRKFRCGFCRKDPPVPYMEMVPHPMNPQIGQMKQKRMMPITLDTEVCSHHPILVADTERGIETLREAARREYLDYRPGKNRDEIAAGFSRVPTLDEAKRIARGADAPRREPVPQPKPVLSNVEGGDS